MKFLVRSADGSESEVELAGPVVVMGRDASCDLVLDDPKCSRRHAIVEEVPEGVSIRDNGSANGVYVNGRQVERAILKPGDQVRLGTAAIQLLPERAAQTVLMGPEELRALGGTMAMGGEELAALAKDAAHKAVPKPPTATPKAPAAAPAPTAQPPRRSPAPTATPPTPAAAPAPTAQPPRRSPAPAAAAPAPQPPAAARPSPAAPPPPAPPKAPTPPPPVQETPQQLPPPSATVFFRRAPEAGRIARPFTVGLLSMLWWVSIPLYLLIIGFSVLSLMGKSAAIAPLIGSLMARLPAPIMVLVALGGVVMVVLAWIMGSDLAAMRPRARVLQIAIAALGLLNLPFAIAAAATLVYMLRADAKIRFSGRRDYSLLKPAESETLRVGSPEGLFAGIILANVALAALLTGFRVSHAVPVMLRAQAEANEATALHQVQAVVAAQEAFKAACGGGYADAEGLTDPASTFTGPAAGAPPLLTREALLVDRLDYHFELEATDPAPETATCTRTFQAYQYLAVPLKGSGRSFLGAPEGVHQAKGRPATPADPLVP